MSEDLALLEVIQTIPEILAERNEVIATAEELQATRARLHGYSGHIFQDYNAERFRVEIDRSYWQGLIDRSGVCATMTDAEKGEYQEKIRDKPPVFNEENLLAFQQNAQRVFIEGFEHTIQQVFKTFTDCRYSGQDWRTRTKRDNLQKIERSFRCHGGIHYDKRCDVFEYRDGFTTGYYSTTSPCFNDLLTACCILDGKPRPSYADNFTQIARGQIGWYHKGKGVVETEYFTATGFKNGNNHVSFKRQDILDMLNKYGSSGQLPDTMRKKYKAEHFA